MPYGTRNAQASDILRNFKTNVYKDKTLHGCRNSTIMVKIIPDFKDLHKTDKNHCSDKEES